MSEISTKEALKCLFALWLTRHFKNKYIVKYARFLVYGKEKI